MTTNQGAAMIFYEKRPTFEGQQNTSQKSAQDVCFLSGAVDFTMQGIGGSIDLIYGDGRPSITVKYGEWLVKDTAGNLSVVSQADMKSKYEQVK